MRLLVVEDDVQLAELLAKGLRTAGFDVDVLGGVSEAKAALSMTRYAALVLDLGLPDGDGLSLAREISALPWSPRVVLTSSDSDAATQDTARHAGAVAFVAKADLPNGTLRALLTGQ